MISDSLTWLQDLVYTEAPEGRNWWSVVLSLLVISLVIAGILAAINTMGYVDELLYWSGRRMTLDEYLQVRNISYCVLLKKVYQAIMSCELNFIIIIVTKIIV